LEGGSSDPLVLPWPRRRPDWYGDGRGNVPGEVFEVIGTYRQAAFVRVFFGQLFVAVGCALAALLVAMRDLDAAAVVLGLVAVVQMMIVLALSARFARVVEIDDRQIAVRTYVGKRIIIAWDDVGAAWEYSVPTFGASRRVRIRSADSSRSFWITELIEGYDELLSSVRQRSREAWAKEKVPLWERILLGG